MPDYYVSLELANGEIVFVKVTAATQTLAETAAKALSFSRSAASVGIPKVIKAQ